MSGLVAGPPASRPRGLVRLGGHARRGIVWAVLLGALAMSIAPFLYLMSLSLMDNPQIFGGTVVAWPWRLENYPEAWVATKIGALYWNSIYISAVSMVADRRDLGAGRLRSRPT